MSKKNRRHHVGRQAAAKSFENFGEYLASFDAYRNRVAMTMRRGLRIERVSYETLKESSIKVAHLLIEMGIKAGDRVMIIADNSPEWMELFFGTQLIGAVLVPIDAQSTIETALNFARRTEPKLVVRAGHLVPAMANHYQTLNIEALAPLLEGQPIHAPRALAENAEAMVVFTSGTTAAPKGVVLMQSNLLSNVEGVRRALNIDPDWRLLSVLPLSHTYELTAGCLAPLSRGCGIYYLPRVTPRSIAKALATYHITTIVTIPEFLSLLLSQVKQDFDNKGMASALKLALMVATRLPFSTRRLLFHRVHTELGGRLDLVITGGAPVPPEVAEAWELIGIRVVQGYGLTETAPVLTMNPLQSRRVDSAGRALDNVRLRVGSDGEIQAKGPNVFPRYWHDPDSTENAFTEDGWFKTGDVGNLSNGWLTIQGRLKLAIVLPSGLKVFPEDIEAAATSDPTLGDFCAIGVDTKHGEQVRAVIASRADDATVERAISSLNGRLASYQYVNGWIRWPKPELPRTRLMKIDRRQVQEWANSEFTELPKPLTAPGINRDAVYEAIRAVAASPDLRISESDTLADLGLDSLSRMALASLIEDRLGVTLKEETLTQLTTIAELHAMSLGAQTSDVIERIPSWQFHPAARRLGYFLRERLIAPTVGIWVHVEVEASGELEDAMSPAIFIFNHTDDFDGPVIFQALPVHIRRRLAVAVADDVLRSHKVLALVARLCFAGFNLRRTEPFTPSLELIGTLVDQGWSILLAPEGKVSETGRLQEFKQGIGLLATALQVPVVPLKLTGLTGTVPLHAKWPRRHSKVTVRIGHPITMGPDISVMEATQLLHDALEKL